MPRRGSQSTNCGNTSYVPYSDSGVRGDGANVSRSVSISSASTGTGNRKMSVVGFPGLINLGSTCYMNSLLQSLFMAPEFRDIVFKRDLKDCSADGVQTSRELQKLFFQMASEKVHSIAPRDFLETLGICTFGTGGPRDIVMERRRLFELLRKPDGWEDLDELFRGQVTNRSTCIECSKVAENRTFFDCLLVPLRQSEGSELFSSLEDCLKCMVGEKNLSKEDSLTCANCKSCGTKFQTIYTDWPRLLSIQLMRFEMNRSSRRPTKVRATVTFPTDRLDLSEILQGVPNYEAPFPMYELLSVVAHNGSVDYGHYIAFAKDPDSSRWYRFNDSSVSESDVTDVEATFGGSLVAYYLLYRKKDGQEKHFLPLEKYPSINHLNKSGVVGFPGLINLGSTCYMNSLLQSLFMAPEFRDIVFKRDLKDCSADGVQTSRELQKLFFQMAVSLIGLFLS